MISRHIAGFGVIAAVLLGVLALLPVSAQGEPLSEAHLQRIRGNCVNVQNNLRQLHANDGLMRVNRGQMYEAISVKLMVPLNSRITLNRLDGGSMVDIAADYNQELISFRENYRLYERQLSSTMRINCDKAPQEFYESVKQAGESRKKVHANVVKLHDHISEYQKQYREFGSKLNDKSKTEEAS